MFQSKFEHVVEENKKLRKIIAELKIANKKLRLDDDKKLILVILAMLGSAIIGVVAYSYGFLFNTLFVKESLDKFDKSQAIILGSVFYVLSYFYYKLIVVYRRKV